MQSSRLLQWGSLFFSLAILFFLIKRLYRLLTGLEDELVVFQPFWLIVSLGILLSYRTLLVYPWRVLYCSNSQTEASFQTSWMLCQLSQLGKYLPGKIGQFMGLISLSRPLGLSKTESVVSTLQTLTIQCILGFCMGMPVLLSPSAKHFWQNWIEIFCRNVPILIGLAIVIVGLGCIFFIFFSKGMFLKRMETFPKSMRVLFSISGTLRLLAVYLLLWVYFGIGFFLFVKSLTPAIQFPHLLMITGMYPFAWSIGFLSLVTPSGLGVREGVLSVLLTLCLPPADATLIALLSRVWAMSADIALASIAGGFYFRRKRKNSLNIGTAKT